MYNDLLGIQRESHPWIKSNEISSFGTDNSASWWRQNEGKWPFCLPPLKESAHHWDGACQRPHLCLGCHTWTVSPVMGRAVPVPCHCTRAWFRVGHCVVACLHLAAIPKEQTGSGFGFFTPLGSHRSLLPSATGAHASDHVWVVTF